MSQCKYADDVSHYVVRETCGGISYVVCGVYTLCCVGSPYVVGKQADAV